ncbi:autotransporter outer membrane beta-barrel domain-containing protein [Pseudomonas sp. Marseille-Q5115]|uniref:autotransporter outer membrane beta-barrel domain-containing protein n=1 Tax=Pseudomonas sp. Marseille-Q5115 TaxID=2866593 RepID=UPI001CE44561|nr:autotransporter outer membrane beta-barrel domain-containing protein [Pseudomonas sp. Marseille-Q5115]
MDSRSPGQSQQSTSSHKAVFHSSAFQPHRLSLAIVAALSFMAADGAAAAAGSCGSGTTTLSTRVTEPCSLGRNESLTVTADGGIKVADVAAVVVQHAVPGRNQIFNSGTLAGEEGIVIFNTVFSGKLQNTATGVIEGMNEGISLSGSTFTGNVLNAGTITSTQAAALSLVNSTVIGNLSNSGLLAAERNGAYGRNGLLISGSEITGDLRNSGSIATGSTALHIENSKLGGSLINSGDIRGTTTPMIITGSTIGGDFINYGSIYASDQGSRIYGTTIEGRFANHGSIGSGITGFGISGSTIKGGLLNTGRIYGGSNVFIQDTVMGGFENSGTIDSGTGALDFLRNTVNGNFINRGEITTNNTGYAALIVTDTTISGSLVNLGSLYAGSQGTAIVSERGTIIGGDLLTTGSIEGRNGLVLTDIRIGGDLANTGAITTDSEFESDGDTLRLAGGSIGGDLINSGSLQAEMDAIYINGTDIGGSLINAGEIKGENGAYLQFATIGRDLQTWGSITGSDRGLVLVNSTVGGRVVNDGDISGGIDPFTLLNTVVGDDVVNRGSIVGGSGAAISGSTIGGDMINQGSILTYLSQTSISGSTLKGRFANYGTIGTQGGDTAWSGLSVSGSTVGGEFTNAGKIIGAGTSYALDISNSTLSGRLVNRGSITGARALNVTDSTLASVTNTGTLKGRERGVSVQGDSELTGGLVNAGLISGSEYSLYVDPASTLNNLYIAGNDTARFAGNVYAPNTTATLYSDATYSLRARDRWNVDSFINRGTLVLSASTSRSATPATITGDYSQRNGAVLRTEVLDQTHYGKLVVTGTATLPSRALIDVDVANASQPFRVSQLQDVLSAGTLKSDGTFAVTGNSALFDFGAVKDGNTVDLTLAAKSATGARAAVASSGLASAAGVAGVLDAEFAKGSSSSLAPYFVSATSTAQVANALSQTLPLGNASLRASQAALGEISQALQDRLVPVTSELPSLRMAPTLWSKPFTSLASGARGSSGASGQVIGMDTRTSSTQRVGLAFAYADGDTQGDALGNGQNSRLDLWQFTGYSAYTLAPDTEFMVYAGAGHNRVAGERSLALSGVSGKAKGEYNSLFATVGASLGHAYRLSEATRFVPSARLDYNHIRDQGYREQGSSSIAPLLLSVDGRQTDQLIAGLDGRLEHEFSPGGSRLQVNLGVGVDLINDANGVTASFAGAPGQRFETRGSEASPWLVRGGLSLVTPLTANGAELTVNYSAQSRSDYDDSAATVAVKVPF